MNNRWVCVFRETGVCFLERGMGKKVLVCVVDAVCGGEEEISRIGKTEREKWI